MTQATAKAQEAAAAAQEKASELRDEGSGRLREQVDQRSTQAGSQMRSLAEALRRSGSDLAEQGNGSATQITEQVADRIDRVGGYLESKSGDDLVRDVESFARRRPWMFAGLGLLAGVAAARFVKASSEQRYDHYRRSRGMLPMRTGSTGSYGGYGGTEVGRGQTVDVTTGDVVADAPLTRDPGTGAR